MADTDLKASAGHTLGSQIGDWFEEFFVFPLLQKVATELKLFLDSRFIEREARTGKIQWQDVDGNSVAVLLKSNSLTFQITTGSHCQVQRPLTLRGVTFT